MTKVLSDEIVRDVFDLASTSLRATMVGIADVTVDNAVVNVNESGVGQPSDTAVTNPAVDASLVALTKGIVSLLDAALTVAGTVAVSNFPATQPVSGTVAVSNLPATQPASIADGSDVAQGAKADAAVTSSSASASLVALLKGLLQQLQPSPDWAVVTPSDSVNLASTTRALYFATAGNAAIVKASGVAATVPVVAGLVLPVAAMRVNATSTTVTAGNILALF